MSRPPLFEWQHALRDPERRPQTLNGTDVGVGLVLSTFCNMDGTSAYPSVDTLAKASNRAKSTVLSSLDRLEEEGCIERSRTSRRMSFRYRLRPPSEWSRDTTTDADGGRPADFLSGSPTEPSGRLSEPSGSPTEPSGRVALPNQLPTNSTDLLNGHLGREPSESPFGGAAKLHLVLDELEERWGTLPDLSVTNRAEITARLSEEWSVSEMVELISDDVSQDVLSQGPNRLNGLIAYRLDRAPRPDDMDQPGWQFAQPWT